MKAQLVTFPGCPNIDAARGVLSTALAEAGHRVAIEDIDATSDSCPEELRGWGSPTILIDGRDVGGEPGPMGTSCRLYTDSLPGNRGVPSVAAVVATIKAGAPLAKLVTSTNDRTKNASALAMGGALVAALAASACCIVPALLGLLGISGLGFAAALESYRPHFLAIAAGFIGLGFYFAYGRRPAKTDACDCERPTSKRLGKAALWGATVAVAIFAAYPYVAGAMAETKKAGTTQATGTERTALLHITGMTCESCVPHLTETLAKEPGVVEVEVLFAGDKARVIYDPKKTQPKRLAQVINQLDGYRAEVLP